MDNKNIFHEKIKEYKSLEINAEQQKNLNSPTQNKEGLSQSDRDFMENVLNLIASDEIDINSPSSLLNEKEYEKLSPENKIKVEMRARTILHNIRRMKDLHDSLDYETESYQMESIIGHIRQSVDALEDVEGDVLKI